jgi:succinate-semialdehyde dehydrogenase/glutarate-semialdehyde dehydrogenase
VDNVIRTTNPYSGETLSEYRYHSEAEAHKIIDRSWSQFQEHRLSDFALRSKMLTELACRIRDKKSVWAQQMALEMGKPVQQGLAEAEKCATAFDYYAENVGKFLQRQKVASGYDESWITFCPSGPILAIMPWNFPFWQALRFAAPAIAPGNSILLRHASLVQGCARLIEELFEGSKLARGLLCNLALSHADVAKVIADPRVRGVTFTGSTDVGRRIATTAAENLKKCVLELGGSDAYIVLADCNLDHAVKTCVQARLVNSGQSCVAGKRFIIESSIYDTFAMSMRAEMSKITWGDPSRTETVLGPMASRDLRDQLHEQVQETVEQGAELLLGGVKPPGNGAFYPPTILSRVQDGMRAYEEELFGPAATLIEAESAEHAVYIANSSDYGLGGGLFTSDLHRGQELIEQELEAGFVVLNDFVKSDPRLPFGGVKDSGIGRELSQFGLYEFCNIKTVAINNRP